MKIIKYLFLILIISAQAFATNRSDAEKPNIILVLADDMSWFDVGAYHKMFDYVPKNAITPNIDKIAEEGMLFTRAFTATAMCGVTRQQLYTGIYPVRSGAYGNHTRVKENTKSIAHYFRDLGYRVGLAGKGHIFPHKAFPFERVGKENKGSDGESSFGIEKTRKFMSRSKDPFLLIVASANPHGPYTRGDRSQYPIDNLDIPSYLNDSKNLRHQMSSYLAEVTDLDREVGLLEEELNKLNIKENTIFIFTSEQGSSFPFGKWTTYDLGLQTAFIIRWPKKIEANTITNAMIEYIDVVPTLTDLVNNTTPNNIDGLSFKEVLQGKKDKHKNYVYGIQTSLNIHHGNPYPIRSIRNEKYKLIHNLMPENNFSNAVTNSHSFKQEIKLERKSGEFNYINYIKRPEFELYDISKDPFERNNLYKNKDYDLIFSVLKKKLDQWMAQQGDEGIAIEMKVCERMGFDIKNPSNACYKNL